MRRTLSTMLAAVVLLLVVGYAAIASVALTRVWLVHGNAQLASQADPTHALDALDALSDATIRTALAASPLEQITVNVAMVREARERPPGQDRTLAWLPVLRRLGWRDTPALQNLLYAAGITQDLPELLDVSDALLRRQQLMDQILPIIVMIESDPRMQSALMARLAAKPSWRGLYMSSTGSLRSRDQLLARFAMIRRLQRNGVRLDRGEVIPNINALDHGELPAYGFVLWRSIRPQATRPIDDINFALASVGYQSDGNPVPYQWQTMTGDGFRADVSRDNGRPELSINWDGRGVPLFAQQRTSAAPGRYALVIAAPRHNVADLPAIVIRLVCPSATILFEPVGALRYITAGTVPCAYPMLQIAGDIQPSVTPREFAIDRITMTPLASGKR